MDSFLLTRLFVVVCFCFIDTVSWFLVGTVGWLLVDTGGWFHVDAVAGLNAKTGVVVGVVQTSAPWCAAGRGSWWRGAAAATRASRAPTAAFASTCASFPTATATVTASTASVSASRASKDPTVASVSWAVVSSAVCCFLLFCFSLLFSSSSSLLFPFPDYSLLFFICAFWLFSSLYRDLLEKLLCECGVVPRDSVMQNDESVFCMCLRHAKWRECFLYVFVVLKCCFDSVKYSRSKFLSSGFYLYTRCFFSGLFLVCLTWLSFCRFKQTFLMLFRVSDSCPLVAVSGSLPASHSLCCISILQFSLYSVFTAFASLSHSSTIWLCVG